ncbi:hypothetical protein bsdE14_26130 [Clostridium omnivorum]|uniref:Uncharacterized protein n=1 Tax=Clostridium omnivorum TaxID=1604902 RepID=A0ABQ5N7G9_9CLOT|nr:hypothetical protein bsdE14_26130 [Clostridium sp. E14]
MIPSRKSVSSNRIVIRSILRNGYVPGVSSRLLMSKVNILLYCRNGLTIVHSKLSPFVVTLKVYSSVARISLE